MSKLKKVTIIIPTYNRQNYAIRSMKYWSGKGPNIIYLDGSKNPIAKKYRNFFLENINYIHLPISYIKRIEHGSNLINTEFCVMLSDDEFFSISGLNVLINELENNKNIISCMGRTIGFFWKKNKVYSFSVYDEHSEHDLMQNSPVERMNYHMKHYTPSTIYSLTRSNYWKKAWGAIFLQDYNVHGQLEIQFEILIAYLGKSKILPILYWFRSGEEPSIENPLTQPEKKTFYNWWNYSLNDLEKNHYLKFLKNYINDNNNSASIADFKNALNFYGNKNKNKNKFNYKLYDFLRFRYLPQFLKDIFKMLFFKRNFYKDGIKKLLLSNVLVNIKETKEIESLIKEFHNK